MHFNTATLFLPNNCTVDATFYTSRYTWDARLRGLRRWCERNKVAIEWPMWALMGGNSWTAHDIANA